MQIGEFRNRVSNLFVDGSGNLAALYVSNGNVHVRRRDGGRQCLKAVGDSDDNIGLEIVEDGCEFEHAQPRRLRHGCGVLALEHHVNTRRDREAVLLDVVNRSPVTVEER